MHFFHVGELHRVLRLDPPAGRVEGLVRTKAAGILHEIQNVLEGAPSLAVVDEPTGQRPVHHDVYEFQIVPLEERYHVSASLVTLSFSSSNEKSIARTLAEHLFRSGPVDVGEEPIASGEQRRAMLGRCLHFPFLIC